MPLADFLFPVMVSFGIFGIILILGGIFGLPNVKGLGGFLIGFGGCLFFIAILAAGKLFGILYLDVVATTAAQWISEIASVLVIIAIISLIALIVSKTREIQKSYGDTPAWIASGSFVGFCIIIIFILATTVPWQ